MGVLQQARKKWNDWSAQKPRTFYSDNGYYIFRGKLDTAAVQHLRETVSKEIYTCQVPLLRHHGGPALHSYVESASGERIISNSLLHPHMEPALTQFGKAVERLICSDEVADLLSSLDEEINYTVHQMILFFKPPNTQVHIDGWGMDSWPRGHCHTLWIPLENVSVQNSTLLLASWRLGEFISPEGFGLTGFSEVIKANPGDSYYLYQNALMDYLHKQEIAFVAPQLKASDMVVFSSLTPHATVPFLGKPPSRLSLQIIVRATNKNWTWFPESFNGVFNPPDDNPQIYKQVSERWRIFLPDEYRAAS